MKITINFQDIDYPKVKELLRENGISIVIPKKAKETK